ARPGMTPMAFLSDLLQGNSALPGDEIVLTQNFGFGTRVAAGNLNHAVENRLAHLLNRYLSGNDSTGIDIDDVRHALREARIGGDFQDRGDGIARRRPQPRGEKNHVRACTDLGGDALHVITGGALQIEASLARIFRIIQHGGDGRGSAFFCRAGRLHRVGEKSVADISGRGIHFESGANGLGASGVVAHELDESVGYFLSNAAVDQFLFHSAQLGKLGENSPTAQRGEQVGGVTDGRIRSEEHTSELQSHLNIVCRLLLETTKLVRTYQYNCS